MKQNDREEREKNGRQTENFEEKKKNKRRKKQ